ncbi:MAG: histidinol-phosphate transaminase [Sphingomonas sp.]
MSEFGNILPHVRSIPPYPPGRPVDAVSREFGLDPSTIVKLASNENPIGCSPKVATAIAALGSQSNIYPDNAAYDLCQALAAANGVSPDQVLPGAGSSEIILLAVRAFLDPARASIIPQYAFQSYEGATRSVDAEAIIVPGRGWDADLDALSAAVTDRTHILFLATPNNPTGTVVDKEALAAFVLALPPHVLLILDEAYCEFLDADARPDSTGLLRLRRNMLVMRTFSKIHGLAGLRVGYAMGDPELLQMLRRLQLPFSISSVAQVAAIAALSDPDFAEQTRTLNARERARLSTALAARGIEQVPSQANFILLKTGDGAAVTRQLMQRGVIVRPVGNYGLPEWIRVSIGLPHENDRFLEALDAVTGSIVAETAA